MNNKVPRLVFDIDDVICKNGRQNGYENAEPITDVIQRINFMHYCYGYEIVLYTSRGMISCNGDLEVIRNKNEKVLAEWLGKHDVYYDEIVFGKPLGDLYVDDRGISLEQFMDEDFRTLRGGSGQKIFKLGNIVRKDMKSQEEVKMLESWVKENNNLLDTPKIISTVYDSVYMKFIKGKHLYECLDNKTLFSLMFMISDLSLRQYPSFDINIHIEVLEKNKGYDNEIDEIIEKCKRALRLRRYALSRRGSFSHGDMILSNIIVEEGTGKLVFIDPQFKKNASSYLLDFAKLRMSLDGYEEEFGFTNISNIHKRQFLDKYLKSLGRNIFESVVVLELMYIARLTRYKRDKNQVAKFARKVMAENERLFEEV